MSSLTRRMLGEVTTTGDIAPMEIGPGANNAMAQGGLRRIPTAKPDKQRKIRNRVVSAIIGTMQEDERDGSVIPDDAEEIESISIETIGVPRDEPDEPDAHAPADPFVEDENGLIEPSMALVAPDTTPHALQFLDPSMVPDAPKGAPPSTARPPTPTAPSAPPATSAMDVLMGRSKPIMPSSMVPPPRPRVAEPVPQASVIDRKSVV